ncbi:MAG: hypothetical protein NXH97_17395 [Rhodobacteraceae bacterium]|nr:hypothetical protein [Paracoccaceae bacterium]
MMEIAPLDPTMKLALIGFGAVIAVAGLWLIFRPPGDGDKTVLHFLGLKFEATSAGTLVFIVGIGVFALSLFAPVASSTVANMSGGEADPGATTRKAPPATLDVNAAEVQPASPAAVTSQAAAPPVWLEGAEAEPNDSLARANLIPVGATVSANVAKDNDDYYSVILPDEFEGEISIGVTGDVSLFVYDDLGGKIWNSPGGVPNGRFRKRADFPAYSIRVFHFDYDNQPKTMPYQLTVRTRASED